jgi:AhpD family alkylhydroperoxidase
MAAFVSKVNETAFCVGAHTATAGQAYQDGAKVQAVLADLESAPVEEGLRATLRMLGKLTQEGKVGAEDMREVLSAGVSRQQIEDALAGLPITPGIPVSLLQRGGQLSDGRAVRRADRVHQRPNFPWRGLDLPGLEVHPGT